MAVRVDARLTIPDGELDWRFGPSGGPGGQHANRSNTRVELVWDIASSAALGRARKARLTQVLGDSVRVVVDDERSQLRNRALAAERLADRVRAALVRPKARKPTRRTRASQARRLEAKRRTGERKRARRPPRADD